MLLSPTLATPPLRDIGAYQGKGLARTILGLTAYMPFCPPLNLVRFPAASVPATTSIDGLPLGVQLAAAPGGEDLLLSVAAGSETLRPWPTRPMAAVVVASALVGGGGDEVDVAVLGQEVEVEAAVARRASTLAAPAPRPANCKVRLKGRPIRSATRAGPSRDGSLAW